MDEPDSGVVRRRGVTAGYLPQEPDLDERLSALEAVLQSGSELARLRAHIRGRARRRRSAGGAFMHLHSLMLPNGYPRNQWYRRRRPNWAVWAGAAAQCMRISVQEYQWVGSLQFLYSYSFAFM